MQRIGVIAISEKNPFEVRVYLPKTISDVLAYANVTVCGLFAVKGVRVVKGKDGPFVSMPRYKAQGKYQDICYPCTKNARAALFESVLGAYDQAMKQQQSEITSQLASPQMGL